MGKLLETLRPSFRRQDERGLFVEVVSGGPWETVITGTMHAGGVIGNHFHKHTRMLFYLMSGAAKVHVVDIETRATATTALRAENGTFLEKNVAHAIVFEQDSSFLLLKSQRYTESDPDTFPYSVYEPEPLAAAAARSSRE